MLVLELYIHLFSNPVSLLSWRKAGSDVLP